MRREENMGFANMLVVENGPQVLSLSIKFVDLECSRAVAGNPI